MKKEPFNLVIVAGGLGSRLAPMTNHIPKFLVNIGKNTGYVEMIRYWTKQHNDLSITVIIHSTYEKLVRAYHEMYFPRVPLIIKTVDVANGSAHAILASCDHLISKPAMFSWCDVIPDEPIDLSQIRRGGKLNADDHDVIIFTNYNNSNRYGLTCISPRMQDVTPTPAEDEDGGVFGLYYVDIFHKNVLYEDGQDFVEVLHRYGRMKEHRLEHIIDFGDLPKLTRTRAKSDDAREFNSLTMTDNLVMKKALNEQGATIIEKEIQWYEKLGELAMSSEELSSMPVPKAWIATDRESLMLERVKGVPLWKAWPDLSGVDRHYVLNQIISKQNALFDLVENFTTSETVREDVKKEACDKLISRYTEIKPMIEAFGPIEVVNGYELETKDPIDLIKRLHKAIEAHYDAIDVEYGFIHGDLQFSNILIDVETRQVTFLDPRGYFGNTIGRGLKDYDTGKLLYALSGYDTFNYNKNFGMKIHSDGSLEFEHVPPSIEGITDICNDHFQPIHHMWLAVCWIGLAQYIKNDPVKSVCAHYHGMTFAEQVLHKY